MSGVIGINNRRNDGLTRMVLIEKIPFWVLFDDEVEMLVQFSDRRTCYVILDAPLGYGVYIGRYMLKEEARRIKP